MTLAGYGVGRRANGRATRGSLERITVHGRALEGNLEGDSPDRPVVVYLPPELRAGHRAALPGALLPSRLHGDRGGLRQVAGHSGLDRSRHRRRRPRDDRRHTRRVHASTAAACSRTRRPSATGRRSSPSDLTTFIDKRYRTIASREGRGLAGHSMGGYGTMRIGMKQPAAFAALYAMSSCCLMNDPAARGAGPGRAATLPDAATRRHAAPVPDAATGVEPARAAAAGWPTPCRRRRRPGRRTRRPAAVLRPADEGRRDPAAHRRQVDRQLAAGDGRSVRAGAQVDARDRARRRRPGSVRRHQPPARRVR